MKIKLARVFTAIGTCALLIFLIVVITGGFRLNVGPFRLSATRWLTPLVIAAAAAALLAIQGRKAASSALASIGTFLESRSRAGAIVLTAAAVGIGLGLGTHAASASDASGYVSEAALIASGHLARDEPLARRVGWTDAGWAFSPLGYRPGRTLGEIVPTYPIGLPVVMAAATLAHPDLGPYTVVPVFAGVAVFATFWLGRRLHSGTTGVVAAALLCTSPIFVFQAVQPMSDVPATALWTTAALLALAGPGPSAAGAGALTGIAILTRPNLLPLALLVAALCTVSIRSHPRRRLVWRLVSFAAGAAPLLVLLMTIHSRLYGGPLASGYGELGDLFSFSNVSINARLYAWRVWRGEAPAVCLAVLSVLVILFVRPSGDGGRRLLSAGMLACGALATVLACYLPYAAFDEWFYLRFLLPALPFAFIFVAALLARAAQPLPATLRGIALVTAVVAACAVNIVRADREQAFNLRWFEARYRSAGRYLAAALPPDAIVLSVQQSGSARFYTGRPILRWDQMGGDLDGALVTLRTIGLRPFVLAEEWEAEDIRRRFPQSEIARLDWRPRAEFGDAVRVRLYDPADRRSRSAAWPVDRVH